MSEKRIHAGFTLLELMIVIVIIGILASLTIPRMAAAIRKANEGATRGKVGTLRTAISIYYADRDGTFPADLTPITQPGSKYYLKIFPAYTFEHGNSNDIAYPAAFDGVSDAGSWAYVTGTGGPDAGRVWILCVHTDAASKVWNQY